MLDKDELMKWLWPDSFVEEANLAVNISQLRKALGQSDSGPQYIETVPKRGYRFVANVKEAGGSADLILREHVRSRILIEEEETDEEEETQKVIDVKVPDANGKPLSVSASARALPAATTLPSRASQGKRSWLAVTSGLVVAVLALSFGLYEYIKARRVSSFQSMKMRKLITSGKVTQAAISPDGKYVAYVEGTQQQSLLVRQVAATNSVLIIPPAEVDYRGLTFTPDGNFIYFIRFENNVSPALYQVPVLGGTAQKVLESVITPVTFSPDGKRFAFVREYSDRGEDVLTVVNADGTGEEALAKRKLPEFFSEKGPSWSPDGKIIACGALGFDSTGQYMYVFGVRTGDRGEERIGSERWRYVRQLAWLPDGSGLLILGRHPASVLNSPPQIWQMSYPSGESQRITNDLNFYSSLSLTAGSSAFTAVQLNELSSIYVAPDGDERRAALVSSDQSAGHFGWVSWTNNGRIVYTSRASGNTDIWIMDSDGGNNKQLTFDASSDVYPSASPDGRYIVFVSYGANKACGIWRMHSDGSNPRQLADISLLDDFGLACSPDSKWVVYQSSASGTNTLWKVPIEGGDPIRLTDKFSEGPAVSPDGKLIACVYADEVANSKKQLAIIPFEGGPLVKLFDFSPTAAPDHGLNWTPDGRAIAYSDSLSGIWVQPLDGSPPVKLTDFKSDLIWSFDWSPDGKQLAIARGDIISDVVLITNFR
jgi:Tol biopolymer transport system component/DNA-binding winged helix-turn-helix (wHTH) protein